MWKLSGRNIRTVKMTNLELDGLSHTIACGSKPFSKSIQPSLSCSLVAQTPKNDFYLYPLIYYSAKIVSGGFHYRFYFIHIKLKSLQIISLCKSIYSLSTLNIINFTYKILIS